MKKIEVGRYDVINYFLVTIGSHIVGMFVNMIVEILIGGIISALPKVPRYVFIGTVYFPLLFIFCAFGIFIYLRKAVPKCYNNHMTYPDDPWLWLKNCLVMVLPGELIRGLIFVSGIGLLQVTASIGFVEAFFYQRGYLWPQGRQNAVTKLHTYIPMDYIAAAISFLIVAAIHVILIVIVFRYFWRKAEKAKKY